MAMPNLASATPWGAIATAAADAIKAPPAGPSQSGNITGAPISIAGFGSKASGNMGVPVWVWIAAAAVAVLFVLRKK